MTKSTKGTTVLVSGCYDLLNAGHVNFFRQAKALGDKLVVSVADDSALVQCKRRLSATTPENKAATVGALKDVDEVYISAAQPCAGLDFVPLLDKVKPDILAVTEDDRYGEIKRSLCKSRGIEYVVLRRTAGISTTDMRRRCAAPRWSPLRVDFAGGWFDVPRLFRPGAHIVNCAITPGISLAENWPERGAGIGGSAAWAMLNAKDPVAEELDSGVGWQDPAIIQETGVCVWRSGRSPRLEFKQSTEWLDGLMALGFVGGAHCTSDLANKPRDYDLIERAGEEAVGAVRAKDVKALAGAISLTYQAQISEGMASLARSENSLAFRYCGSGYGGYVLHLFESRQERDKFACNGMAIEPYDRWRGDTA